MTLHNVHFLDLPNAILLLILKKLDNMDVLYSLLGINNQRLDNIVQKTTFTTILNFESISANDDFCSISGQILNRFYFDILPRIHCNVKCLILESNSMEHILIVGSYPNLINFKLFNFNKEIFSRYFIESTRFVDGTHIYNEILSHMTRLRTFTFYVSTENYVHDSTLRLSNNDIQETFKNMENQQVNCIVDFVDDVYVLCKVFSLPFRLDHFEWITNTFSTMIFNSVTYLMLFDRVSFKHEFFVRVARAFPLLKYLSVHNGKAPFWRFPKPHPVDNYSPIAEYLHLISLHFGFVSNCYVDQFLNETKTNLPRLIELKINYRQLKSATENFTRNETRRNYAMVKRLIVANSIVFSEDVYRYFPSS
ncbi:unnamed protein product [Rotaria socialis]